MGHISGHAHWIHLVVWVNRSKTFPCDVLSPNTKMIIIQRNKNYHSIFSNVKLNSYLSMNLLVNLLSLLLIWDSFPAKMFDNKRRVRIDCYDDPLCSMNGINSPKGVNDSEYNHWCQQEEVRLSKYDPSWIWHLAMYLLYIEKALWTDLDGNIFLGSFNLTFGTNI